MRNRPGSPANGTSARGRRGAFTLVEMLTVITIIALLLAITIPSIGRMRIATMRATSTSIIFQIDTACQEYFNIFGEFPPSQPNPPTPLWIRSMQGRQMLVQWLTGYRNDDGQSGYGYRTRPRAPIHGPFNDTDKLPRSTAAPAAFVDSFGEEIFYYRFDTRNVGNNVVTGYFSTDNSGTRVPPIPTAAYRDASKKIYFRQDFILLSAGPDGKFTSFTDVTNKGYQTDDITNFLPE